jgi:hypothetical protein
MGAKAFESASENGKREMLWDIYNYNSLVPLDTQVNFSNEFICLASRSHSKLKNIR